MYATSRSNPRPLATGRGQRGQALVFGLFVLLGGLGALFFLFNSGQLVREKTKLVNTADAIAYSGGLMNARAMNFIAYTNRAMLANTVAIAQLVSTASWVRYVDSVADDENSILSNTKYLPYFPAYLAAQRSSSRLTSDLIDSNALEDLAKFSDKTVIASLKSTQQVVYASLLGTRQALMDEVARANYRGDGIVSVAVVPVGGDFNSFVSRYQNDDRQRFADLAVAAAKRDGFVKHRTWFLPALSADCSSAAPRVDWLDRRGGTELLGLDQWKALDTLSEKKWIPAHIYDTQCLAITENPAAWGIQTAAQTSTTDLGPTHYDYSLLINPTATFRAIGSSSDDWDYSGIPEFYDLSRSQLDSSDPRLRLSVQLTRDEAQTMTSEGRSAFVPTPRLNAYDGMPATGSYAAVASSEVFFERPAGASDNVYGSSIGRPRELGSLFNPYWQVHLVDSPSAIATVQALRGVTLP